MKELRAHQVDAVNMLRDRLRQSLAGKKRVRLMLDLCTGAGKTVIAAAIIRSARAKGKYVLFVVDAISLIDQTVQAFYAEGLHDIGVIQADHPMTDYSKPIQIASVQTLNRRKMPRADIVIVDEAHIIGAVAQGITGPSIVTFADSIEDQEYRVPGEDRDSGVFIRPSLSNPATTFIPNQGTLRYSAAIQSIYLDSFNSSTSIAAIKLWERVAALLGQTDWPFNGAVVEHWRNNAGSAVDTAGTNPNSGAGLMSTFIDYLKARTPSLKVFATTPVAYTNGNANSQPDPVNGFSDEANQIDPGTNGGFAVRSAYRTWVLSGGGGRITAALDIGAFTSGVDVNKWAVPNPVTTYTLKAAVTSGATTTSFKLSAAPPIGAALVFAPGSTTTGSEQAFASSVRTVTDNGDGTFQVVVGGGLNKAYAADTTTVRLTYLRDGTHPVRHFGGMMKANFETNSKPLILAAYA